MKKNRGFTLIEILIVISIGSVVMTIAAARYNQLTQRKRIEQQTKNTVTFLRKIKKMADSGEKVGCTGTLERYYVRNDATEPDKISAVAVCNPGSGMSPNPSILSNQSGTQVQAQHQFTFWPLSRGAEVVPGPTVEIYICKSTQNPCNAASAQKTLSVDTGGNINEL
jgi:prepilin-type N-terminal cleavage/methylation domain-containing protein